MAVDALEEGKDIGHEGRLVFAMVGRYFLDGDGYHGPCGRMIRAGGTGERGRDRQGGRRCMRNRPLIATVSSIRFSGCFYSRPRIFRLLCAGRPIC